MLLLTTTIRTSSGGEIRRKRERTMGKTISFSSRRCRCFASSSSSSSSSSFSSVRRRQQQQQQKSNRVDSRKEIDDEEDNFYRHGKEGQNENDGEEESRRLFHLDFVVGAMMSSILLSSSGSCFSPEPANASVYFPSSNNSTTNPFELRMEKKTYMRTETPKKLSETNRMDRTTNKKNAAPLPLRLSADTEEDYELDERYDTGVPSSSSSSRIPSFRKEDVFSTRTLSALFQWSFIFYVAYAARDGRTKGLKVTKRLGLDGKAQKVLINKTFLITLDFGREVGTWMPPNWAASGRRVILPIRVKFLENNAISIESVGAFCPVKILPGKRKWSVDGDTLRFSIILGDGQNERLEKGDVVFDAEEEITCKCMAWGGKVSRRGKLLVRKTRFGIRKEWRSVGIFSCEENTETTSLGTMRVRERFTSAEMIDSSSSSSL